MKPLSGMGRILQEYNKRYFTLNLEQLAFFYSAKPLTSFNELTYIPFEEITCIKDRPHYPLPNDSTQWKGDYAFTIYLNERYIILVAQTLDVFNRWMNHFEAIRFRLNNKSILHRVKTDYLIGLISIQPTENIFAKGEGQFGQDLVEVKQEKLIENHIQTEQKDQKNVSPPKSQLQTFSEQQNKQNTPIKSSDIQKQVNKSQNQTQNDAANLIDKKSVEEQNEYKQKGIKKEQQDEKKNIQFNTFPKPQIPQKNQSANGNTLKTVDKTQQATSEQCPQQQSINAQKDTIIRQNLPPPQLSAPNKQPLENFTKKQVIGGKEEDNIIYVSDYSQEPIQQSQQQQPHEIYRPIQLPKKINDTPPSRKMSISGSSAPQPIQPSGSKNIRNIWENLDDDGKVIEKPTVMKANFIGMKAQSNEKGSQINQANEIIQIEQQLDDDFDEREFMNNLLGIKAPTVQIVQETKVQSHFFFKADEMPNYTQQEEEDEQFLDFSVPLQLVGEQKVEVIAKKEPAQVLPKRVEQKCSKPQTNKYDDWDDDL